MADLHTRLRRYRVLAEMTQEELADRVGVRRETIVRLEAGRYNPSLKVFSVAIEQIFWFE